MSSQIRRGPDGMQLFKKVSFWLGFFWVGGVVVLDAGASLAAPGGKRNQPGVVCEFHPTDQPLRMSKCLLVRRQYDVDRGESSSAL